MVLSAEYDADRCAQDMRVLLLPDEKVVLRRWIAGEPRQADMPFLPTSSFACYESTRAYYSDPRRDEGDSYQRDVVVAKCKDMLWGGVPASLYDWRDEHPPWVLGGMEEQPLRLVPKHYNEPLMSFESENIGESVRQIGRWHADQIARGLHEKDKGALVALFARTIGEKRRVEIEPYWKTKGKGKGKGRNKGKTSPARRPREQNNQWQDDEDWGHWRGGYLETPREQEQEPVRAEGEEAAEQTPQGGGGKGGKEAHQGSPPRRSEATAGAAASCPAAPAAEATAAEQAPGKPAAAAQAKQDEDARKDRSRSKSNKMGRKAGDKNEAKGDTASKKPEEPKHKKKEKKGDFADSDDSS